MTTTRVRMSGRERREQLLGVACRLFAADGFEAVSVERIAREAGVTKPVVYEHFGGKEGLFAVLVDREISNLADRVEQALGSGNARERMWRAADAFLSYVEERPDGFRVLVRDAPAVATGGSFGSLVGDVAAQAQLLLEADFKSRDVVTDMTPLYAHTLVGMVALVGQWWLESGKVQPRDVVATHLTNIAWNGLRDLDPNPTRPNASSVR